MVSKVIQTFGGSDCLVLRSEKICSQVQFFFLACCFLFAVREQQRGCSRRVTWLFAKNNVVVRER